MLTEDQNTIIYIMFLNGIIFLGLNFIAQVIVFPGERGSKVRGYMLIVAAITAFSAQQEFRGLVALGFSAEKIQTILMAGFIAPIFFISLVYYRIKKNRQIKEDEIQNNPKEINEHH
jgi:Ca2+/Na+ antiporter